LVGKYRKRSCKPLAKILRGMLRWEPGKRPSISDVLQQLEKEFGGILVN